MFYNQFKSSKYFCINNYTQSLSNESFDLENEYCNCPFIIENLSSQLKITIEYVDMQLKFSALESSNQQYILGNTSINPNSQTTNQANNVFSASSSWSFPLTASMTYRTYIHCKKMEFTVPKTSYFGSIAMNFTENEIERALTAAVYEIPALNVE